MSSGILGMARLRLAESRMEARRRTRRRCVLMLAGGEWTQPPDTAPLYQPPHHQRLVAYLVATFKM